MITYIRNDSGSLMLIGEGALEAGVLTSVAGVPEIFTNYGRDMYFYYNGQQVSFYKENKLPILVFDEDFWQDLLEVVATLGQVRATDEVNSVYDTIVHPTDPQALILQSGNKPLEAYPASLLFKTSDHNNKVDSNSNTSLFFNGHPINGGLPPIGLRQEDGTALVTGDLSASYETFLAILATGPGGIHYRVQSKGVAGGGGTAPETQEDWSVTVSNRANVIGHTGRTYKWSANNSNSILGSTSDLQGIRNGQLCPLKTGKGQVLNHINILAAAAAVDGGNKADQLYISISLYKLTSSNWSKMYDFSVPVIHWGRVGTYNNLGGETNAPVLAELDLRNYVNPHTLEDNILYGIHFNNSGGTSHLNALGRFSITISGEQT